jgi:hypothetical protein
MTKNSLDYKLNDPIKIYSKGIYKSNRLIVDKLDEIQKYHVFNYHIERFMAVSMVHCSVE